MITMNEDNVFLNKVTMKFWSSVASGGAHPLSPRGGLTQRCGCLLCGWTPVTSAGTSRTQTYSGQIGRSKAIHDLFGRKGQALLSKQRPSHVEAILLRVAQVPKRRVLSQIVARARGHALGHAEMRLGGVLSLEPPRSVDDNNGCCCWLAC